MVKNVIHSARPRTPFRAVTASRGKAVRAEPVSSLMETGRVRLVGSFPELEDELFGFTTHGFMGDTSPNRADAMVWAISDLFPDLVTPMEKPRVVVTQRKAWGF
jgi:phage terminase large subunit-like protein